MMDAFRDPLFRALWEAHNTLPNKTADDADERSLSASVLADRAEELSDDKESEWWRGAAQSWARIATERRNNGTEAR